MQLLPMPQGLYPYPNAGRNDYESFGNSLAGLGQLMEKFAMLKRQNRTVGDVMGRIPNAPNPSYFAGQPPTGSPGSVMGNPLQAMGYHQPFQSTNMAGGYPANPPMTTPAPNPIQERMAPFANMKLSEAKEIEPLAALYKAFNPSDEDMLYKMLRNKMLAEQIPLKSGLMQSEVERNKAIAAGAPDIAADRRAGTAEKIARTKKLEKETAAGPKGAKDLTAVKAKFRANELLLKLKSDPDFAKDFNQYSTQKGIPSTETGWFGNVKGLDAAGIKNVKDTINALYQEADKKFETQSKAGVTSSGMSYEIVDE